MKGFKCTWFVIGLVNPLFSGALLCSLWQIECPKHKRSWSDDYETREVTRILFFTEAVNNSQQFYTDATVFVIGMK